MREAEIAIVRLWSQVLESTVDRDCVRSAALMLTHHASSPRQLRAIERLLLDENANELRSAIAALQAAFHAPASKGKAILAA